MGAKSRALPDLQDVEEYPKRSQKLWAALLAMLIVGIGVLIWLIVWLTSRPAAVQVPIQTNLESGSPVMSPTITPTTTSPVATPTVPPVMSPTTLPVATPTIAPIVTPDTEPMISPTNSPSRPPSSGDRLTKFGGTYELLETVPHDDRAFTQGLELIPNSIPPQFWESTGLNGRSSLRRVNVATGVVLQQVDLDTIYFGEGLTQLDSDRLIQLTWKSGLAFVYDAATFALLQSIPIDTTNGQGWGICKVESEGILYVSDGTQYLHRWDATTFELLDKVEVATATASSTFQEDGSVLTAARDRINELEWDYHRRSVLANVWYQDYLVRIDPVDGRITHQYDLSSLPRPASANVLNGIAVTEEKDVLWVTGKEWPSMYKIRLVDGF